MCKWYVIIYTSICGCISIIQDWLLKWCHCAATLEILMFESLLEVLPSFACIIYTSLTLLIGDMDVSVIMYVLFGMFILLGAALGLWFLKGGLRLIGKSLHHHEYFLPYFLSITHVVLWLLGLNCHVGELFHSDIWFTWLV